jgi:hypothetical protein
LRISFIERIVDVDHGALGYEDLVDHDQLRHEPVLGVLVGKLKRQADEMAPLAGRAR